MNRTRTTGLLLLGMGLTSMTAVAAIALGAAAHPTQVPAASAPTLTAAGETPCTSCLKCPCGCSPLAGAWLVKLSAPIQTVVQTFKFAPINEGCTKFVVNSQASTRSAKAAKFWPDACDLTEFVGIACKDVWSDIQFTTVGYGVKRCDGVDRVLFIAIMTGKIEIPDSCLVCGSDQTDLGANVTDGGCREPDELKATIFVSYFDAAQDQDRDGLPDCPCDEAVICISFDTCLKRVKPMAPCTESKSFVACLTPCRENNTDVSTPATGRAFIAVEEEGQNINVVLTVQNLKDVTKATLQVDGVDAAILFPLPPETKGAEGECEELLSGGKFPANDFIGPLKGKKVADLLQAIEEGKATVVVFTEEFPKGEICGPVEDP